MAVSSRPGPGRRPARRPERTGWRTRSTSRCARRSPGPSPRRSRPPPRPWPGRRTPPPRRCRRRAGSTPRTSTSVAFTIASTASKIGTKPSASMNPTAPAITSSSLAPPHDRRPRPPDRPVGQHLARAVDRAAAGQERVRPELAVHLRPRARTPAASAPTSVAGPDGVEHLAVPAVVLGVGEPVLGGGDPARDQPRRQPADRDHRHPPVRRPRAPRPGPPRPSPTGRRRGCRTPWPSARPGRVEQPGRGDGAGVDREPVVAGAAGLQARPRRSRRPSRAPARRRPSGRSAGGRSRSGTSSRRCGCRAAGRRTAPGGRAR